MDQTTLILFGRFPRECANPSRFAVNTVKEFDKFVSYNNGVADCFTSVYPSNYLIDKIFFDFDYGPQVLEDTKAVYRWILNEGYSAIPIVSGRKGYHIYMITKPKIYGPQAKLFLTRAAYHVIKEVFGSFKQELYTFPTGKQVQVLRVEDRLIAPDPMVCGDIRRITRIPNTLRPPENYNYCTYLPPDEFLDMDETDIAQHMKKTHNYNYEIAYRGAPLLTDFEYDFYEEPDFDRWSPISTGAITTSNPNLFLKELLRPCLYRHITNIHPSHEVRVAATVDLYEAGYDSSQILSIYETLGWEDFDARESLKQIKSCKKYKSYSCSKLRTLGVPRICCVE